MSQIDPINFDRQCSNCVHYFKQGHFWGWCRDPNRELKPDENLIHDTYKMDAHLCTHHEWRPVDGSQQAIAEKQGC